MSSAEDARVSVLDRGFLYGDAAFEVLRTFGGRFADLDLHVDRLVRSTELLRFIRRPSPEALTDAIVGTVARRTGESYVRVVVTRGTSAVPTLDLDVGPEPNVVVYAFPLVLPPARVYAEGISLVTIPSLRAVEHTSATSAKVTSYLANLLAKDDARRLGADEALFATPGGDVTECASANVFAVFGDEVVTPPLATGVLPGITRRHVLACASSVGLVARERTVPLADLVRADEVFVTSSIRGIVPVARVDGGRTFARRNPDFPRTNALRRDHETRQKEAADRGFRVE
ncbi:MAG: aminotransferase class IV [Polyangiaceae bacterium]